MDCRPVIIVDIDNTILSQNKRKQKIIQDIFGKSILLQDIEKCFSLDKIFDTLSEETGLSLDEINCRFNPVFFGQEYYEPEMLDVIHDANVYLTKISDDLKIDIYYVSSRSSDERELTLRHLEYHGFPKPNERHKLFLLSPEDRVISTFESRSYDAKNTIIRENIRDRNVLAGIGDTAADMAAYYNNKIQSVLLQSFQTEESIKEPLIRFTGISSEEYDSFAVIGLDNWEEIYHFLEFALGGDNFIKEICDRQSSDYANWLGDLDNKASMTLIISTFCATTLFDFMVSSSTKEPVIPLVFGCLGVFFSLFAVYLAIRSFASRETHGSEQIKHEKLTIKQFISNCFSKKVDQIEECDLALNSQYASIAFTKYIKHRYGSLEKNTVQVKTFYGLRSSNYKKIYYENKAKLCLQFSIVSMIVLSLLLVFSHVFPLRGQNTSIKSETVRIIQNEKVTSTVAFSIDDFSESLSTINEKGLAKVDAITASLDNQTEATYISISGLTDDESISAYKCMIMGTLVENAIYKACTHSVNVVIIFE